MWLKLDVEYPSACDLYLDGRPSEALIRRRGQTGPILIENGIVSESSSAPLFFSPIVVTGEKKAFYLHAT